MRMPSVKSDGFPLKGGLNLVTPPLAMPDGSCRDALNFECDVDGGYRRVSGYERLDGRAAPADALYSTLPLATLTGSIAIGDTVNGQTSGATGVVIALDSTRLFLTAVTGSFSSGGENIRKATTVVATNSGSAFLGGADSPLLNAQYLNAAADVYRALIQPVPGSGSVLGVWTFNDTTYAFRNNAGGTAAIMYKATSAGWVALNLNNEISFSNANTSVNDGDTLTQGAVTATILRVVVETGTMASGTNTGRLIIGAPSGGNFASGAATSTGGGSLTLGGVQTAITLAPGGHYEFTNHNFSGTSGTYRMYGASGTNRIFEFDGTVYVPIKTGLTTDTPSHIAVHLNYLFISYKSSLIRSSIGTPYMWSAITGAAEFAAGEDINEIHPYVASDANASMVVLTTNKTKVLYGSIEADLRLVTYNEEAGGYAYTAQSLGDLYMLDQLGVRQLSSSQAYGNFEEGQITRIIRPWITPRVAKAVGSCIVRQRNQYRLYFQDKSALYITFDNGKIIGMMPVRTSHTFNCVSSQELVTGEENILAGGTDGYVYRLERGTSFDGDAIEGYLYLAFSFMRGSRIRKTFKSASYEISGGSYSEMDASFEIGYGDTDVNQGQVTTLKSAFGTVLWDSFTWDSFYWDGRALLPLSQKLGGTAVNISLILRSNSDYFDSFTVYSAIIHYIVRRLQR